MAITGIIFLLLLLISLGFFIFMLVKTARGWGGLHVTMLVFIFISTWVFIFAAAGVAKRRVSWIRVHDKLAERVETLQADETKLRYGDLGVASSDQVALVPTLAQLNRLTADRGRVWRNATMQNADVSALQIQLAAAAAPAAGNAVPPNPAGGVAPLTDSLPTQLVVYVFAEAADEATGRMVPRGYLGEYLVTEVQGPSAKLVPTQPLHPLQASIIEGGNAAQVTIYELMPLDSHEAFAAKGSEVKPEEIFGRMDRDELAKLFFGQTAAEIDIDVPAGANPLDPMVRRALLFRSYAMDGQAAPENSPPGSIWVEVEFTKEYSITVDAPQDRPSTEGGFFDIEGRTVDQRLKRGADKADVKFKPGDKRIFLKEAADRLTQGVNNGEVVAKAVRNIFVRPLNNYEYGFRTTRQRIAEMTLQIDLIRRENEILQRTTAKGQEQLTAKQVERQKLDKDLAQVEKERAVAFQEVERLEADVASLNTAMKDLYRSLRSKYEATIAAQTGMGIPVPAAP